MKTSTHVALACVVLASACGIFYFLTLEEGPAVHSSKRNCVRCNLFLNDCSSDLKDWFQKERRLDPSLHISCSKRGKAEQENNFRAQTSKSHFGQSAHNYSPSRALDVFFLENSQATWDLEKLKSMAGRAAPAIAWGGTWTNIVDNPHFEETNWKEVVKDYPLGNE